MPGEPLLVQPPDHEAYDRADDEGQRRPHIKSLHRHADEQSADQRPDDRPDAADAEFPAGAVGAQRGRIDQRADHVDRRLDAEHEEAGEEDRDQKRRLRRQAGIADGADDRHRQDEHDGDGEEAVLLQPPAQHQRADRAADLQARAGERDGRRRQLSRRHQGRRPADEEEVTHQVEREQQPQQRRDQLQALTEQVLRIEALHLLLVFDDEARIRRHGGAGVDRADGGDHLVALALVQRHELDRLGETEDRGDGNDDRHDAADQEDDRPAMRRHQRGGDEARNGAAERHEADGDDGERGAQPPRRRLRVDGDDVRNDAADAEARKQAQPEHLVEVRRIGGADGENAEHEVGGDQRRLAAVAVADPSEQRRAEQDADQAGAEHRAERLRRDVPLPDEMRRREGDRGDVVAVDQHQKERPDQQDDLERAEAALVEQARYRDDRLVSHYFPL